VVKRSSIELVLRCTGEGSHLRMAAQVAYLQPFRSLYALLLSQLQEEIEDRVKPPSSGSSSRHTRHENCPWTSETIRRGLAMRRDRTSTSPGPWATLALVVLWLLVSISLKGAFMSTYSARKTIFPRRATWDIRSIDIDHMYIGTTWP
jgi:hypothetical protein